MRLSRLSNRQLRRLLARGEVRFAQSDYQDLIDEYDMYQKQMFDTVTKMESVLIRAWKRAEKRSNDKMAKLMKKAHGDIGKWKRGVFNVENIAHAIQYNPDPIIRSHTK